MFMCCFLSMVGPCPLREKLKAEIFWGRIKKCFYLKKTTKTKTSMTGQQQIGDIKILTSLQDNLVSHIFFFQTLRIPWPFELDNIFASLKSVFSFLFSFH